MEFLSAGGDGLLAGSGSNNGEMAGTVRLWAMDRAAGRRRLPTLLTWLVVLAGSCGKFGELGAALLPVRRVRFVTDDLRRTSYSDGVPARVPAAFNNTGLRSPSSSFAANAAANDSEPAADEAESVE